MAVTSLRPEKGDRCGSTRASAKPHSPQNLEDGRTISPQAGQITKVLRDT